MARIARGAVTITDIADGTSPVSAVLTNQNHTFPALANGDPTDIASFSTEVLLYTGAVQSTFIGYNASQVDTTGIPQGRFTIVPAGSTDGETRRKSGSAHWSPVVNNTTGVVSVSFDNGVAGDYTTSAVFEIVVKYNVFNINTGTSSIETAKLDATLSVVKEGIGGVVISLSPSSQVFYATNTGTMKSGQDRIVIDLDTYGTTGDLSVFTSLDNAAFVEQGVSGNLVSASTAGALGGWDTNDADPLEASTTIDKATISRLIFYPANIGNSNNSLSVKVTGSNGGSDTIAIMKVRDGLAAISVVIESNVNGFVFKNNSGTAKTLTARVYDMADGSEITSGITYNWTRDGGAEVRINNNTDRLVQDSGGVSATTKTIVVGPEDIDNNSAELFSCEVTVA
jgi:hypothetical protein